MTKHYAIFLLFVIPVFESLGQVDTITHQSHKLEFTNKGKKMAYRIDGKETNKANYEKAKEQSNNFVNCKPCWLRTLNKKGELIYEGDFYQDCCIGAYIERYNNGNVKLKGQCKPDRTACFTKQGEWTYYKINGDIEKVELYKDGVLIK